MLVRVLKLKRQATNRSVFTRTSPDKSDWSSCPADTGRDRKQSTREKEKETESERRERKGKVSVSFSNTALVWTIYNHLKEEARHNATMVHCTTYTWNANKGLCF